MILRDKGLAKLGDAFVNLCYSLAKSIVIGAPTGAKVQDRVLANAIRATPLYKLIGHRTDAGTAGDAYEAVMAHLWLSDKISLQSTVDTLVDLLEPHLTPTTSRRHEVEAATSAFQKMLEQYLSLLSDEFAEEPLHKS